MYQRTQPAIPSMLADLLARLPIEAARDEGPDTGDMAEFLKRLRVVPPEPEKPQGEDSAEPHDAIEIEDFDDGDHDEPVVVREVPKKEVPEAGDVDGMTAKDLEDFADAFHKKLFGVPRHDPGAEPEGLKLRGADKLRVGKPLPGEPGSSEAAPIIQKRVEVRMAIPVKKTKGAKAPKKPKTSDE